MTVAVASPCIKVCVVDGQDLCRGCLRTLGEIAAWTTLTDAERGTVLARVDERRRMRAGPDRPPALENRE